MSEDPSPQPTSLVDSHCHIDLLKDPAGEVKRAESAATHTVAVTNAPSVFFHTSDLCDGLGYVHAALGLHPELVHSHGNELTRFKELLHQTTFVGEVGIDFVTSDQALRRRQCEVFQEIVDACESEGGKILTVHSRRAATQVLDCLGRVTVSTVILHWFSGSRRELTRAIEAGCYFSANPAMLTSQSGLALIAAMPRERVLTETDGPFVKFGNRPCGPADVAAAVRALANAWNTSEVEASRIVRENFARILGMHDVKSEA